MRKAKYLITAVVVAFGMPSPVDASYISGNQLYQDCVADKSDSVYYSKSARCSAYIVGAVDAWELAAAMTNRPLCVPDSVTVGQLKDVVEAYLRANPAKRHYSGANLVGLAINEAFGCAILPQ